ncbi:leucine-rich repeat domain-containing protein [Winogradskyella sp. SYSU M77433]|uniref:leucine-rich repeat domain-containing protein n=1 Tax=Winogradskyella sp. SYSU M77433 TaxID=3042722 RepID=UPI00248161A9|nr:leucine-rich repeat domain-containing protein [Winogradskyella sp. SYSU M77433]MDH7913068.1 leucine-rich repeat domain-containing protein [Winogradskyella sp. SYSU M77433]
MSKKQVLIFMTLCISTIGLSQTVGDTFVDNFITYEVTSISPNTVSVTNYDNNNAGTDADIPATVTNSSLTYSVTSISDLAFEFNGPTALRLTSVIIPNSITSIGNNAFSAQNLSNVTIPSSVVSIGNSAFVNNDLTSITLEMGLVSIGDNAFQGNQIVDVVIPNSVTSIGQFAFSGNQLTSVTLSNSLTTIEWGTFSSNQLQSVVIPNSVTSIGNSVFNNNQITSLTLSNSLLTIGNGTFRGNNLTHVTIPSSVTDIDFAAFRDNPLATVTSQAINPPTIYVPGINDSFWNRSVIDLTIPAGTSAAYAAGGWTGFNSVTEATTPSVGDTFIVDFITYEVMSLAPNNVRTIDYDITGGSTVDIPDTVTHTVTTYSVTSIGLQAFTNKGLTSVTIGNNVTGIGFNAFFQNQISNTIIIPNSVTTIEGRAFDDNLITDVMIGTSVTTIEFGAFRNNPLSTVTSLAVTPPTIITDPGAVDSFSHDRSNINLVVTNNTTDEYVTDSGALWTGFKMVFEATSPTTVEVSNYDPANGTNVVIPPSVTAGSNVFDVVKIDDSSFQNIGLTSVTIPNSVTEIGISAFELNNLTSVTIPDSVTLIGTTAFATNSISNLTLGANLTDIGIGAFVDNNLSDITIPSNVTFIGLLAFGNNPLASVTSLATTPPTITTGTNDTFAFNRNNIHLHIPTGTMGAYVTDPGALWTGFNPVTEDALSVDEFDLATTVKVITATNAVRIISNQSLQLQDYTMYSISGMEIVRGKESTIPTSNFASGIYILRIKFDRGTVVKKFILK